MSCNICLRFSIFSLFALRSTSAGPGPAHTSAAAVKGQVEALLKKFRGFALAPLADGAGEVDATKEEAPLVGDGGVQG